MRFSTRRIARPRAAGYLALGLILSFGLMVLANSTGLPTENSRITIAGGVCPEPQTIAEPHVNRSIHSAAAGPSSVRSETWIPEGRSGLQFGVAPPTGGTTVTELNNVASIVGERPSIVMSFHSFGEPAPLEQLDTIYNFGATPMITWEPWLPNNGPAHSASPLQRLKAGEYDAYLREWGSALAKWGHPILLRFGHEMNENWYPWGRGNSTNTPADFIDAWRHVHDVLAGGGADNVVWVWSPNAPKCPSDQIAEYYPGQKYVDVVSLDGYNWGTSKPWSGWTNPEDIFGLGLQQLRTLAPDKPVIIGETSSSEDGGSKAAWNRSLVSYLLAQPDILAFIWFDMQKEADWRLDSSQESVKSISEALSQRWRRGKG